MLASFGSGIRLRSGNTPFFSISKSPRNTLPPSTNPLQTLTLKMEPEPAPNPKRPTCPSCSRPTKLCLCTRLKTPPLENSVAVTVLQHRREQNHPLNSTRIAAMGLKNLTVTRVSEVHIGARFDIRFLEPGRKDPPPTDPFENLEVGRKESAPAVSLTIGKRGDITSVKHPWGENLNFDELVGFGGFKTGFVVKKTQKMETLDPGSDHGREFEIVVAPGSVVLFPGVGSMGVGEINFEVRNVIVLDGTWAKARRMYEENPWLRLVPRLRLEAEGRSLYGEVRRQPRAGCLSSLESIVYGLKAVGEDVEGLDCLLEVFGSMIDDQRRCKNERLSNISSM